MVSNRRPLTPVGVNRQQQRRHGHKRKGKPVEAWKMEMERDENSRSDNMNAIQQIADGVEQMLFSWNLETSSRSQERAAKTLNTDARLPLENQSLELKEKSACTICHKFTSQQQVTTKVTGPACMAQAHDNLDLSCNTRNPKVRCSESFMNCNGN